MSILAALRTSLWNRLKGSSRWLLVALPSALLGVDLLLFPMFEIAVSSEAKIRIAHLLVKRRHKVGSVRGHGIEVALDSVARDSYLNHLKNDRPNALVVSCFLGTQKEVGVGSFGRAVAEKLARLSPRDAERLRALLAGPGATLGSVRDLRLELPADRRVQFPVDYVFVVTMLGVSQETKEHHAVLDRAVPRILKRADALQVDTLVLPVIGHNWRDEHTFSFEYFFDTVFGALGPAAAPRRILIDLYGDWPTPVIEEAVAELNASIRELSFSNPPRIVARAAALPVAVSFRLLVPRTAHAAESSRDHGFVHRPFLCVDAAAR